MSNFDGPHQPAPFQHCALCPATAFPRLAYLPDVGRLTVYPVALQPAPLDPTGTSALPTAPPSEPPALRGSEFLPPPSAAGQSAAQADPAPQVERAAEAVLIFWSQDRHLEATLAALPGVQLFDWQSACYQERHLHAPGLTHPTDAALQLETSAERFASLTHTGTGRPAKPLPPPGYVPQPLLFAFAAMRGCVEAHPGPGVPLATRLQLPAVPTALPPRLPGLPNSPAATRASGRISGAFSTGTPISGTRIPSPVSGIPIIAANGLVGLRLTRAPSPPAVRTGGALDQSPRSTAEPVPDADLSNRPSRAHPNLESDALAEAGEPFASPAFLEPGFSAGLIVGLERREELLVWIGAAPPTRTQGLQFAVLPDAVWIDRLTAGAAALPPLLNAERLSAHPGSIGSTLWLKSGAAWTPPLAVDILLDRLNAVPYCDYVLQADTHGALRCRYVLDRNRLLPFDRAAVRTVLAALPPSPLAPPANSPPPLHPPPSALLPTPQSQNRNAPPARGEPGNPGAHG